MPRPARLLLLACSKTKATAPGLLPVRQRYRGSLWLTLAAVDPAGDRAQVVALSALLGFVGEGQAIPTYEHRLTLATGRRLAAGIEAGQENCGALADAAAAASQPLQEVALCAGAAYLPAMRAAVSVGLRWGWIAPDARVTVINSQIGYMRQQLRAWLTG